MNKRWDVVIVGAGIAGLTCGRALVEKGYDIVIVEALPGVGGRMQTDVREGFRLDRGFQVLQLAYPEARRLLDYDALDLHTFPPGARIRARGRFHLLADPLRRPRHLLRSLTAGVGTIGDRVRLARLAREAGRLPLERLMSGHEEEAGAYLVGYGFSQDMIERFFTPFLGGICLDPSIRVTSRFLRFVIRMFAEGDVAVPALGMGAIPGQVAASIPEEAVLLDCRVDSLSENRVNLADGRTLNGRAVVLATPEPETMRLLGKQAARESCREDCLYYAAESAPVGDPYLVLNGEGRGILNSVAFPSLVAATYAPAGATLVAAIAPGVFDLEQSEVGAVVRRELREWFGSQVDGWEELHHYRIEHALPRAAPPSPNPYKTDHRLAESLFHCGEAGTMPAIQWALLGGERTARAVHDHLAGRPSA